MDITRIVASTLTVLTAGLVAGIVCKKARVSLLIGYLLVGALIGEGGLRLVTQEQHELAYLAEAGALLLLFSVGIELSLDELYRFGRYFFVAGMLQMLLVAAPLTLVARWCGLSWNGALLAGSAGALSSTVLVFRALAEVGHADAPHGKRAIGILLFQDVALVPLLLLVPLLTGRGGAPTWLDFARLGLMSVLFIAGVALLRALVRRWLVTLLAGMRSVELVVLFAVCALGAVCWVAHLLGLPAAVGALAAGLALSGNRLSHQVDTILLPFRETFAAVFFVSLGMLLDGRIFLAEPLLLGFGLCGMLLLKAAAALLAMRAAGLSWASSLGMGMGLAQLGEFSFLLVAQGVSEGIISAADYNRMLFVALGTLILTPWLLSYGLRLTDERADHEQQRGTPAAADQAAASGRVIVVGIGPIGRQLASRMELLGIEVCLVDLSPINLFPFAQQGFRTVAGDARDPEVLQRCGIAACRFVVICVPDDLVALDIVRAVRTANLRVPIIVRCRFLINAARLIAAGAAQVVSEEAEAAGRLLQACERLTRA